MSFQRFLVSLLIVTTISVLCHIGFLQWSITAPYAEFSLLTIVFFTVLCLLFFTLGEFAANSKNIYLFSNLILGMVLLKMICCIGLVIAYKQFKSPADNMFVVPFAAYYFIYTAFELYFMTKLGKTKVPK